MRGMKEDTLVQDGKEEKGTSLFETYGCNNGYGSEVGTRIADLIETLKKKNDKTFNVNLYNDPSVVRAPLIIVNKDDRAVVMLIEEGILNPLQKKSDTIGGEFVSVQEVATDILKGKHVEKTALTFLTSKYPSLKNPKIINTCIVPKSTNLEDEVVASFLNAYIRMAIIDGQSPLTVKNIKDNDAVVTIDYQFTPGGTAYTVLGRPLASDFKLNVKAGKKMARSKQLELDVNSQNSGFNIASVNGHIDCLYQPKNDVSAILNQSAVGSIFNTPVKPDAPYIALVVVNENNGLSPNGRGQESLINQCYGLLGAAQLTRDGHWSRPWAPVAGQENPLPCLGLVGMECNLLKENGYAYKPLKVNYSNIPTGDKEEILYSTLVASYFKPNALLCMDVELGAPNQYAQNLFLQCLQEDDIRVKAEATIRAELDRCLDNKFSKHFAAGTRIVSPEFAKLHSGNFKDPKTNADNDVNSITNFQKLKFFGDNPEAMSDLQSVSANNGVAKLHRKAEILSTLVPTFEQTGWKIRMFFSHQFNKALQLAAQEAGLVTNSENLSVGNELKPRDTGLGSILDGLDDRTTLDTLYAGSALNDKTDSVFGAASILDSF